MLSVVSVVNSLDGVGALTRMSSVLRVKVGDRWYDVEVADLEADPVQTLVDGEPVEVHLERLVETAVPEPESESDETPQAVPAERPNPPARIAAAAVKSFNSPMPGVVLSVAVQAGDQVVTGDEVCVLEAMKMQQVLRAEWSGIVRTVHVHPGQQVSEGAPIVDLE